MIDVLIVGAGGFIGASLRYICMMVINLAGPTAFPWATFVINIIGCFFIGFFSIVLPYYYPAQKTPLLFFTTGLVGGYTAIATWGLETVGLLEEGNMLVAGGYIAATVVGCLVAVYLGRGVGRLIYGS